MKKNIICFAEVLILFDEIGRWWETDELADLWEQDFILGVTSNEYESMKYITGNQNEND